MLDGLIAFATNLSKPLQHLRVLATMAAFAGGRGTSVAADDTALIGLDWGTSSLRAYRLSAGGRVIERRDAAKGILAVPDGRFVETLEEVAGDWLRAAPRAPVIASGMIGSRQGWREVPYAACPAGLAVIAEGIVTIPGPLGREVRLVPGLSLRGEGGIPDVMRGEETQILGALAAAGGTDGVFLLPGTHSKWAWVEAGRIARFATYMTGEVYAVLSRHSILGRLMAGEAIDGPGFARGLARAREAGSGQPGDLLHEVFSARTLALMGDLPGDAVAGYLSGLLIGAEVTAALARTGGAGQVTILGGASLTGLYRTALTEAGMTPVAGDPDAAAQGLHALALAGGLIEKDPR